MTVLMLGVPDNLYSIQVLKLLNFKLFFQGENFKQMGTGGTKRSIGI